MGTGPDICVVVEGCYPYVTGGVSSWLQWLMTQLNEYRFAVTALVAEHKKPEERRYPLPENVVHYQDAVLFDYRELDGASPLRLSRGRWKSLQQTLLNLMDEWQTGRLSEDSVRLLRRIVSEDGARLLRNFLDDEPAFEVLTQIYAKRRPDTGFVHYFYNTRNIHLVLFNTLLFVRRLPPAAVYHAPGTGFAGFLACLGALIHGGRSVITEHGIYVQEREMELLRAGWLQERYQKDMWIRAYQGLCTWQYHQCDRLVTLFYGNTTLQERYGAPKNKSIVIPNGIDIGRFAPLRRERCRAFPRRVGFVGRVSAVKDVKTFLQVVSIVRRSFPDLEAYVVGPYDEEPDYYRECLELSRMLGLKETVRFTGAADVRDYYKIFDLLVLTSVKEAMPLVVMEAMTCGIPVVATDVGACRELLLGRDDDLGAAGRVRRIMDVDGLADACVDILGDPELANRMSRAGIARIEKDYRDTLVLDRYRGLYEELLHGRP